MRKKERLTSIDNHFNHNLQSINVLSAFGGNNVVSIMLNEHRVLNTKAFYAGVDHGFSNTFRHGSDAEKYE